MFRPIRGPEGRCIRMLPQCSPRSRRADAPSLCPARKFNPCTAFFGIVPVKVVEFRVWAEVATGQAAWGVTWVSSAGVTSPSIVGGASKSAMASTCM